MGSSTATRGTPSSIHRPKVTSVCAAPLATMSCQWRWNTTLGGVPIRVPTPPMLAPYATASTQHAAKRRAPTSRVAGSVPTRARTTVTATGISMRLVAVLLTHMETRPLARKKPRTRRRGRVPARRTTANAKRRWSPVRSMASARQKPPRNSAIVSSK